MVWTHSLSWNSTLSWRRTHVYKYLFWSFKVSLRKHSYFRAERSVSIEKDRGVEGRFELSPRLLTLVFRMCDILMSWVCHAHLLVLLRILPHKAQQQRFMFLAPWANSECLLHHGKYHWDIYIIHNLYLWANGNGPSVWKSLYICRTRMWRWYCYVLKAVCLLVYHLPVGVNRIHESWVLDTNFIFSHKHKGFLFISSGAGIDTFCIKWTEKWDLMGS